MEQNIDSLQELHYTQYQLEHAAAMAADRAVCNLLSRLADLDNDIHTLSVQTNRSNEDMARLKVRVPVGDEIKWVSANNAQELVNRALDMKPDAKTSPLLIDYASEYIKTYKANGSVQDNTLIGYNGYLRNHFKPAFGDLHIHEVDANAIQKYINSKRDLLSVKTIREHINLLSMIFDAAVEDGYTDKNPCQSKRLTIVGKSSAKVTAYTEHEYKQLESALPLLDGTPKLLLALSLYTGMRQGELFALRWEDIDMDNKLISIKASAEWPCQNRAVIKTPKTINGYRNIPIIQQLVTILYQYKQAKGYVLRGVRQKDDLPMTHQAVKRLNDRLNVLLQKNNINIAFLSHRVRHSFATLLNNAGVDDVTITSTLGHADVSFTKRQYVTPQDTQVRRGMSNLSEYIDGMAYL